MKLTHLIINDVVNNTYWLKIFLITLMAILCFLSNSIHAQEIINKVDNTIEKRENQIDSLQQQTEKFTNPKAIQKTDSTIHSQENKVDSLHQKAEGVANQINTPINKINQKSDSISRLLEVDQKINGEIVSKKKKLEQNVTNQKQVKETQQALGNIQRETGMEVTPELQGNIPKLELPNQNLEIPTQDLSKKLSLPKVDVQKVEGVGKVAGKLGDLKDVSNQLGSYKGDIKAISEGKVSEVKELPKLGEKTLKSNKEIQALEQKTQELDQFTSKGSSMKGTVDQYKDKEYLKKQVKKKVMEKAIDHFALRNKELQQAQQELAKVKRKFSSFNTQTGEFVKRASLKDRPFYEHITWGILLQIHQGPPVAFDLSPFAGYRFNKLWTWSLSGSYRFVFNSDKRLTFDQPVYGGRTFLQRDVFKKLFIHAEAEWINSNIPSQVTTDDINREWVQGYFIGTGKTYNITKKIKGNVLLMYNLKYTAYGPYITRWNTRMGFIFH